MSNTPTITATPSYEAGVYKWYDVLYGTYFRSDSTVGTNASDSMDDTTILFEVPSGYLATLSCDLTVDDWGTLTVTDETGSEKLKLSLTSADDAPGVRGGHAEWSDSGSVNLPAGKYQIKVHHENVTYTGEYADKSVFNSAKCNFTLRGSKQPVPENLMTNSRASALQTAYAPVSFSSIPTDDALYAYVGGEAEVLHEAGHQDFQNSAALRLSIAFDALGIDMSSSQHCETLIKDDGSTYDAILDSVYMTAFVVDNVGTCHALDVSEYLNDSASSDILFYSDYDKVGICTGAEIESVGAPDAHIWILHRAAWSEPETSKL